MTSIDGLFEQIIHYEKTTQERKCLLQELRQAVFSTQEKGKLLEQKCCEFHEKLKRKLKELSNKELLCNWLASQEVIYTQQYTDLERQLQQLDKEQELVKEEVKLEKESFCMRIARFTVQFGPSNSRNNEREQSYSTELVDVLKEKEILTSSLEEFTVRHGVADKLSTEKDYVQKQLEKIIHENTKLKTSLCEELRKSTDLEEERQSVTSIPHTDLEFISLQDKLEDEKKLGVELGEQYTLLQNQLQQLHQILWQQQVLKQQQSHNEQQQLCDAQHMGTVQRKTPQNKLLLKVLGQSQKRKLQQLSENLQTEKNMNNLNPGCNQQSSEVDDCNDDMFSDTDDLRVDNLASLESKVKSPSFHDNTQW